MPESSAVPPPIEHQRLVVRGAWLTLIMLGLGFGGAMLPRGLEIGLLRHVVTVAGLTSALGTMVGLVALAAIGLVRRWRGWARPVLIATAGPAFVLGLMVLAGRLLL